MMPPSTEFDRSASNQKLYSENYFQLLPGVNENRYLPSPQTSSCQEPTIQPPPLPCPALPGQDLPGLDLAGSYLPTDILGLVCLGRSIIWFARPWTGIGSSSNKRKEDQCQEDQFKKYFLNALSEAFPSSSSWSLTSTSTSTRIKIFKFFSHERRKKLVA